jgi:hypothetical protein
LASFYTANLVIEASHQLSRLADPASIGYQIRRLREARQRWTRCRYRPYHGIRPGRPTSRLLQCRSRWTSSILGPTAAARPKGRCSNYVQHGTALVLAYIVARTTCFPQGKAKSVPHDKYETLQDAETKLGTVDQNGKSTGTNCARIGSNPPCIGPLGGWVKNKHNFFS